MKFGWPASIAAALGTTVAANLAMLAFATRNPPVLESPDAYERGLAWQAVVEEQRAAAALHWRAEVAVCPQGRRADGCEVVYEVRGPEGHPVEGLGGTVRARRADDAALDAEATVEPLGGGRYRAALPLRRGGLYRIEARLSGGTSIWLDARRVSVKEGTS